jgi:excisionase family DNA binding protein
VRSQLGLFETLQAEPAESSESTREEARRDVQRGPHSASASIRSLRQARDGRGELPRLCVKPDEAAQMLGVSRDYFDEHVKPELRIVRRGRRILIALTELERWLDWAATRPGTFR